MPHHAILQMMVFDDAFLEAALLGYQAEAARITAAITDLQQRLGKKGTGREVSAGSGPTGRKGHRISAEGRARIAAAQRKRWAAAKKS